MGWGVGRGVGEFLLLLFFCVCVCASKELCESWGEFLALLREVSALKTLKVNFSGFLLDCESFLQNFISEKSQNQGSRFDTLKTRPQIEVQLWR